MAAERRDRIVLALMSGEDMGRVEAEAFLARHEIATFAEVYRPMAERIGEVITERDALKRRVTDLEARLRQLAAAHASVLTSEGATS